MRNYGNSLKKDTIFWLPVIAAGSFFLSVGLPFFFEFLGDALCTSSLFARALSWSLALCPTFHSPLLAGGYPPVASSGSTALQSTRTKGPGGLKNIMLIVVIAGKHFVCKTSDLRKRVKLMYITLTGVVKTRGGESTDQFTSIPRTIRKSSPPNQYVGMKLTRAMFPFPASWPAALRSTVEGKCQKRYGTHFLR